MSFAFRDKALTLFTLMASLLTHWVKYPGSIRTLFRTSGISSNSFAKDPTGGSWIRGDASSLPVAILSLVCDNSPIPSQQTWAKKPFKNQMVTPIKKTSQTLLPVGIPKTTSSKRALVQLESFAPMCSGHLRPQTERQLLCYLVIIVFM